MTTADVSANEVLWGKLRKACLGGAAPAAMQNLGNNGLTIKRTGIYLATVEAKFFNNNSTASLKDIFLYQGSTIIGRQSHTPPVSVYSTGNIAKAVSLTLADEITASAYYASGASDPTLMGDASNGSPYTWLTLTEVPSW